MRVERVDAAGAQAAALMAAYVEEMAATLPQGFDPAASVSADPDELTPPRGAFLVLRADPGDAVGTAVADGTVAAEAVAAGTVAGAAVAAGGVKLLDPRTAEVKRMWVAPGVRGAGVGRRLLSALEDAARGLGADTACLDTHADLTAALALYRRAGWHEVSPYNGNRYATHWFVKHLAEPDIG